MNDTLGRGVVRSSGVRFVLERVKREAGFWFFSSTVRVTCRRASSARSSDALFHGLFSVVFGAQLANANIKIVGKMKFFVGWMEERN